jgi:signal transduction histidine kinase
MEMPICILGLLDRDRLWLKSAVGLSRIGLMNDLASSRQLSRRESFCTYVVESQQVQAISDAAADPAFATGLLVQRYGIRAYLGVPLVTSNGHCLGTLAVMSLTPRSFTGKETEILQLIARWSISEFERNRLIKTSSWAEPLPNTTVAVKAPVPATSAIPSVKSQLMSQMAQELCTPLTSILGMARVLSQGIYGTLTDKQREYIDIIHNSGQYLSSLVNEVLELGTLDDRTLYLTLNPIDVEMLCQQALSTLKQAAQRHHHQIQLTMEPGPRICLLDKDKVRQMLYHLIFSVMQSSNPESIIRIHISRRQNFLNLAVWTSHPWLGDGLSQADVMASRSLHQVAMTAQKNWGQTEWEAESSTSPSKDSKETIGSIENNHSRQSLGLLLSRQLAELHGGSITIQGSIEEGYRYVIKLPQLKDVEETA